MERGERDRERTDKSHRERGGGVEKIGWGVGSGG